MRHNVAAALVRLGSHVQEEILTDVDYSIDAVFQCNGVRVAMEADAPTRLLRDEQGCFPAGTTLMKHRQLRDMDERTLMKVMKAS